MRQWNHIYFVRIVATTHMHYKQGEMVIVVLKWARAHRMHYEVEFSS